MSRAIWSALALRDLDDLDSYFRDLAPDHSLRIARLAVAAGRFLADNPGAGSPAPLELRKWRVKGTDYLILYRASRSGIEITRLMHARRNWRAR